MDTTTKHAIPFLEGTDLAAEADTVSQAQAERIDDIIAIDSQGTFALRPASTPGSPGKAGRYYFATDTGKLYRDHGTGWTEVVVGTDSRLTDQRTPSDSSVTVAKTGTGDNGLARGCFRVYRDAASGLNYNSGMSLDDGDIFDAESWDVSGWFNPATGRFTPQQAGYYRLNVQLYALVSNAGNMYVRIKKNNTNAAEFQHDLEAGDNATVGGSTLVAANGTTDYFSVEIFPGATGQFDPGPDTVFFEGEFVGRS